jgi:chromosome segregation ATPase
MGDDAMGTVEAVTITPGITTAFLGFLSGIVVAFLGYMTSRKKANVDQAGLVLEKWKELFEANEARISGLINRVESLERENGDLRQQAVELRNRVSVLEDALGNEKRERRAVDEENAGLRRQIAALSEGSVVQMTEGSESRNTRDLHSMKQALKRLDKDRDNGGNP